MNRVTSTLVITVSTTAPVLEHLYSCNRSEETKLRRQQDSTIEVKTCCWMMGNLLMFEGSIMTSILWNPMREMESMRHDLDRLFYSGLSQAKSEGDREFAPALQLWETDADYVVKFRLPGVKADEIAIEATPQTLMVSGAIAADVPEGAKVHYREYGGGTFRRSLKFPGTIDTENVAADYSDGVLTISLPKTNATRTVKVSLNGSEQGAIAGENS